MINNYLIKKFYFIAFPLLSLACCKLNTSQNKYFKNLPFVFNLEKHFVITKYHTENKSEYKLILIDATSGNDILKSKTFLNLSKEEAEKYILNQAYKIESTFNQKEIPYPGQITNRFMCSEKLLPQKQEQLTDDSKIITYSMFANDRFAWGGCDESLMKYYSFCSFVYCKNKNLAFNISYFTPINSPSATFHKLKNAISCQ